MENARRAFALIVCAVAFAMAISVGSVGAANLLANPGFEEGAVSATPGQSGIQCGWNYSCDNGYFRPETVPGPVVEANVGNTWTAAQFIHAGAESMCTSCDLMPGAGWDVNSLAAQRHAVTPGAWYAASAWVYAREMIAGSGLGYGANDHAGVRILELDENEQLLVDRGLAGIYTSTTGFVQVSTTFQTGENTRFVDYKLDTLFSNPDGYWGFRAIYDDCVLEAVPEPASLLALLCGVSGMIGFARRRR